MYTLMNCDQGYFKLPIRPKRGSCQNLFLQKDCLQINAHKIICPPPKEPKIIITSCCNSCVPCPPPEEVPVNNCCNDFNNLPATYFFSSYNIDKDGWAVINTPDDLSKGTYYLDIRINNKPYCCEPIFLKVTECL